LMPLVRSHHLVDFMWADLLFVVSPLDPQKLPRLAEFVRRKTHAISGGECELPTCIRLGALLNLAVAWDILGNGIEPTWKYLLDVAENFSAGDIEEDRLEQAFRIADAILRDSVLRRETLRSKVEPFLMKQIITKFINVFSSSWLEGIEQVSRARKGSQKALLGPMARFWPKILGLVLRMSLHLETRNSDARTSSSLEHVGHAAASPLETVIEKISDLLQGEKSIQLLRDLESSVGACSDSSPRAKRPRISRSCALPSDIDLFLQIYGRFAELLNVSNFLAPTIGLVASQEDGSQSALDVGSATRVQELVDIMWRWSSVADEMQPLDSGSRRAEAWVASAYAFQQMGRIHRLRITTSQTIANASKLFRQITCDVPSNNSDIRSFLQPLFWLFEFRDDHDFCNFIRSLLGEDGILPGSSEAQPLEAHGRLQACIKEELPRFTRLRSKICPELAPGLGVEEADAEDAELGKDADLSKVISSLSRCQRRELPSPCRNLMRA